MEFPSRHDVAMALVIDACGDPHDFPDGDVLVATEAETDESGHTVNISRIACRACGMIKVSRWREPGPTEQARGFMVLGQYEYPEPGDVPGIVDRARRITDAEYAKYLAAHGFGDIPSYYAPDRRATTERYDFVLRIRAGQFFLLERPSKIGEILPIPPYATSTDLIDAVPGAALCWAPVYDGEIAVTVVTAPEDPGPDRSYPRIAELSCRFHTGAVYLCELTGCNHELPPLPAGYGDYRLRLHTSDSGCLLQIWSQPYTKPLVHPAT
ncbi:hypothetical protein AB4305_31545 [Nocardia sp. 2YAB30]|uniref:hypothetical protein n=1 Tax=unclassified Nocardia TaxID=2637762 RepID=UPI003F9544FF